MNWLQLLSPATTAVVATIGTVLVGLFTFYLDRRKAAEERAFVDKRSHYINLLLSLKSLREGSSANIDLLWFEYSFLWLHAPDPVIKSANALVTKIRNGRGSGPIHWCSYVADPPRYGISKNLTSSDRLQRQAWLGFVDIHLIQRD